MISKFSSLLKKHSKKYATNAMRVLKQIQKNSALSILFFMLITIPVSFIATQDQMFSFARADMPLTPPLTPPITPPFVTPTPVDSRVNRVFLTSIQYNGNLGGVTGADIKCQERANSANLGGTWKAWISNTSTSAASRLIHSDKPYKLLNSQTVANNWTDLTDGTIQNSININEFGGSPNYGSCVWTSTKIDGSTYPPYANNTLCNNYTAADQNYSMCGHNQVTGSEWTNWSSERCDQSHPLYCIEQVNENNPISYKTDQVSLQADNFYITANGQKYFANNNSVRVHSDPGNPGYTTLEVKWMENGKEMRLYMYFYADGTYWWSPEIRTYNGQVPGNWIYYTGGLFFRNFLGYAYQAPEWNLYADMNNPYVSNIHFENLKIQAFLNRPTVTPSPTIHPTITPTVIPSPTPTVTIKPTVTPTMTPRPTIVPPTATPTPKPKVQIRVNAGGPGYPDSNGKYWSSDYGYIGGQTYSVTNKIKGTKDPAIYQTERFNLSGYEFKVPNGIYTVILKFSENYPYCQWAGCRIFNVSLEGKNVLTNFDIYKEAKGGYTAIDKTFTVNVKDGKLNINFQTIRGTSKISGIEIK